MLLQLFSKQNAEVNSATAFIAGDRQSDGIFNLWSIGRNITIRSLGSLRKLGLIDLGKEKALENDWKARMAIRT